jgi:hypothetical protein
MWLFYPETVVWKYAFSSKWEVGSWKIFRSILRTTIIKNEKLIIQGRRLRKATAI